MVAESMQCRRGQEENEIRRWQAYQALENLFRNLVHPILVNDEELRQARTHKHILMNIQRLAEGQWPKIDLHAGDFPSSFLQNRRQSLDLSSFSVK